jgi:hypothetical protein
VSWTNIIERPWTRKGAKRSFISYTFISNFGYWVPQLEIRV